MFQACSLMLRSLLLVLCATSCSEAKDTGEAEDTAPVFVPVEEDEGCAQVELRYDGPDAPVVGDQWTLLLFCDDALLTGSSVIRWAPDELGTLNENVFTFGAAVTGTLTMKVGTHTAEREVSVGE